MHPARPAALPALGLFAALAGFAVLQAAAFWRAGVFEYPLDDVYIHLAMAEKIAGGTYGVNWGEAASASSSIIYPFLLMPIGGAEIQRYLPLFWNTLAVAGCGWVWGRIIAEAMLLPAMAVIVVLIGPILLNISGVGYVGMEAAPHMLASLVIVLGLWIFLKDGIVSPWLVVAAIAAPLFRYEGLALALAAAGVLALKGARGAGLTIALVVLGAVVGFGVFLLALGLEPLPGSILAKMSSLDRESGFAMRVLIGIFANLMKPAGVILAVLVAATLIVIAAFPDVRRGHSFWLLTAVGLSGLAHLVFGQIGWMDRYEPYILVCLIAALLLATTEIPGAWSSHVRRAAMVAIMAAGFFYGPAFWRFFVWNPRAIHLQQAQMAELAQDYLNVPVAVNDLGRVAWGNPNYVLDLWGLGSAEARGIYFGHQAPQPGWAGPLAESHGVRAAMIYSDRFGGAVGSDWVPVATLAMRGQFGAIGGWVVTLYAVDPTYADEMRAQIEDFARTRPADVEVSLIEVGVNPDTDELSPLAN